MDTTGAATRGFLVNGSLIAAFALLHGVALLIVPFALLPRSAWWALCLAPVALLSNTLWSLVHEAIHGHLLTDRRANERAGRLLAILHGASFRPLRAGHLAHHRYSRTMRERSEVYDPAAESRSAAAWAYYPRILGGLYVVEILGTVSSLLPRRLLAGLARRLDREDSVAGIVMDSVLQPDALAAVRLDAIAMCALYGTSSWLYGASAWMLAAAIAVRGLLVSIADNAYHYGTALDRPREARNLAGPRWLHALLLDFTLHGAHHIHPTVPWFALRRRFEHAGARYDGRWFRAVLAQLAGPIPLPALRPMPGLLPEHEG